MSLQLSSIRLALLIAVILAAGCAIWSSDQSEAYASSTLERYLRDNENHWAYRQQQVDWATWSGGQTTIQRVGVRGGATYGYSFRGWNAAVEDCCEIPLFKTSYNLDYWFYRDWTMPTFTVNIYGWGLWGGDIAIRDSWCHSRDRCATYSMLSSLEGSGFDTCIPYLSTLMYTDYQRHPDQLVGGC
jgi:hypothetical protein